MTGYRTPGVYYQRADQDAGPIPGLRTDVTGFVGVAERGPIDTPLRVTSWRQYTSVFGGFAPEGLMGYAVRAFFENGGRVCHIARSAALARWTVPVPGMTQPGDGLGSFVVPVDGFVPGGVVTISADIPAVTFTSQVTAVDPATRLATFSPALGAGFAPDRPTFVRVPDGTVAVADLTAMQPAGGSGLILESLGGIESGQTATIFQVGRTIAVNRRLAAVEGGGVSLVWERSLVPDVTPGPGLTFATGASEATARFLAETGAPLLDVSASSPGAWGNRLLVRSLRVVGTTTVSSGPQAADRASTTVAQVSGFTKGDLVRVSQAGSRPYSQVIVLLGVDAVGRRLSWGSTDPTMAQWSGSVADTFDLSRPLRLERIDLSLTVSAAGSLLAAYPSMSLVPFHPRFAPLVIASDFGSPIRVAPAGDAMSVAADLSPLNAAQWLQGGRDGLAAIVPADMIGDAEGKRGIAALGTVDEIAILAAPDAFLRRRPAPEFVTPPVCVPDTCLPCCVIEPVPVEPTPEPLELPADFDLDDAFRIQSALVEQCEQLKDRFAVLDAPRPSDSIEEGVAVVRDWRHRFESAYAGLYFPWLWVRDPLTGDLLQVPPCGHVTGEIARADLSVGVHRPPANLSLSWVQDTAFPVDDPLQGVLNPEAINAVRVFAGRGIRVYGARTLSSDPSWRYVNIRRLIAMIEKSVLRASQWAVFEPNDHFLRETLRLGIVGLLRAIWERGGLLGVTPENAFYVKCDDANNPPSASALGELFIEVGVAAASPAEFVVFRVGRVADELTVSEGFSLLVQAVGA
jgi:Bacteriophage tail sheath protein